MQTPVFLEKEYLEPGVMNAAMQSLEASASSSIQSTLSPGLVFPENLSIAISGLQVRFSLPSPFGVVFSSGVLAQGHGTITGQDTQNYTVDFTGTVPSSGAVTAYVLASYVQIQQNPVLLIGPPIGHPDYDPNYVPVSGYQTNVDSIAFSVSTSPADNKTTFEIGRTYLTAGLTTLSAFDTSFWQRTTAYTPRQILEVAGNVQLTPAQAGERIMLYASSVLTLPPAITSDGLRYLISSRTTQATIVQANGTDQIFGAGQTPATAVSSISLTDGAAIEVECQWGSWQLVGGNAAGLGLAGIPTGAELAYWGETAPPGFLLEAGQSVSVAQYPALFAVIGYTFGGEGSIFALPDKRGRVTAGLDNMGGTAAGRLTNDSGSGVLATTIGAAGGGQSNTLNANQLAAHDHTGTTDAENSSHTHSGTTGTESATHYHTSTTGTESNGHTHSGTTGTEGSQHNHSGTTGTENQTHTHNFPTFTGTEGSGGDPTPVQASSTSTGTTSTELANHTHNFTTGVENETHTHSFTSGNESATHTHSVVTGGESVSHTHMFGTSTESQTHTHNFTTDSTGAGALVNNVQPTIAANFIIKT